MILLYPILIAAICVFIVCMANIPHKLKLRFKPFNCEMCLAWWITLILLLLQTDPVTAILLAGGSAYLTGPLKRLL